MHVTERLFVSLSILETAFCTFCNPLSSFLVLGDQRITWATRGCLTSPVPLGVNTFLLIAWYYLPDASKVTVLPVALRWLIHPSPLRHSLLMSRSSYGRCVCCFSSVYHLALTAAELFKKIPMIASSRAHCSSSGHRQIPRKKCKLRQVYVLFSSDTPTASSHFQLFPLAWNSPVSPWVHANLWHWRCPLMRNYAVNRSFQEEQSLSVLNFIVLFDGPQFL